MAADLEILRRLYLFSLTFYGLITGLADFSFTEQCYWYLQSTLNHCLKAAPLSKEEKTFSADEIHSCDRAWLCGLMPFKLLPT